MGFLTPVYRQCAVSFTDFWEEYKSIFPYKRHKASSKIETFLLKSSFFNSFAFSYFITKCFLLLQEVYYQLSLYKIETFPYLKYFHYLLHFR